MNREIVLLGQELSDILDVMTRCVLGGEAAMICPATTLVFSHALSEANTTVSQTYPSPYTKQNTTEFLDKFI